LPWFGKFLIARALYLSIELAIPFFSIHAATYHGDSINGLNTLVIAANIGIILGGFLWVRIGRGSVERVMVLASLLACAAGLMAMAIEVGLLPPTLFCYALVFAAIALGAQGVKNGRTLYLLGQAKEHERPYCIAVANVMTGVVAVAVGALLGVLAGLKGVAWPIGVLIVLNIAAAVYTLRLPRDTDAPTAM
jgi:MFS family permease